MTITEWVIAQSLIAIFKAVHRGKKITSLAKSLDYQLDKKFDKKSEDIQKEFVKAVPLAFSRELMKDNLDEWKKLLQKEMDQVRKLMKGS